MTWPIVILYPQYRLTELRFANITDPDVLCLFLVQGNFPVLKVFFNLVVLLTGKILELHVEIVAPNVLRSIKTLEEFYTSNLLTAKLSEIVHENLNVLGILGDFDFKDSLKVFIILITSNNEQAIIQKKSFPNLKRFCMQPTLSSIKSWDYVCRQTSMYLHLDPVQ